MDFGGRHTETRWGFRGALILVAVLLASLTLTASASAGPPWPLIYPASGKITGLFGDCRPIGSCTRAHQGVDISNSTGTDVFAAYRGTAYVHPDNGGDSGNWIEVVHANGYSSRYLHLQSFLVSNGQAVSKGQHIGEMDSTGDATGPHLHFEVRQNGTALNINAGFPPRGSSVTAKNPMPMDFNLAASDIAPFDNELGFVAQQYLDFTGRPVTANEATFWIQALWGGMGGDDMTNRIFTSAESDQKLWGVVRLYYAAFDRHPDNGIRAWPYKPLGSVASALISSSEGQRNLPTDPPAFVRKVYTNALNRQASASEVAFWADQVRSKGRASVLVSISESSEHRNLRFGMAAVNAAYLAMLDRVPDTAARNYWTPILEKTHAATPYLVRTIRLSSEYRNRVR